MARHRMIAAILAVLLAVPDASQAEMAEPTGLMNQGPTYLEGGYQLSILASTPALTSGNDPASVAAYEDVGHRQRIIVSFTGDLERATDAATACGLYRQYRARIDGEWRSVADAVASRFSPAGADIRLPQTYFLLAPTKSTAPAQEAVSFSDLGWIVGPFSPAWAKLTDDDARVLNRVGRQWLEVISFHQATQSFPMLCDDPSFTQTVVAGPGEDRSFLDALSLSVAGPVWRDGAEVDPGRLAAVAQGSVSGDDVRSEWEGWVYGLRPALTDRNRALLADWIDRNGHDCSSGECLTLPERAPNDPTLRAFIDHPAVFDAFLEGSLGLGLGGMGVDHTRLVAEIARLFPAASDMLIAGAAFGDYGSQPTLPATITKIAIFGAPALSLRLNDAVATTVTVRDSVIDDFSLQGSTVSGPVELNNSLVLAPALMFSNSQVERLTLAGLHFTQSVSDETEQPSRFDVLASQMVVEDTVSLLGLAGAGLVDLSKTKAKVVQIAGKSSIGQLVLRLVSADNLIVHDNLTIGMLDLSNAEIPSVQLAGGEADISRVEVLQAAYLRAASSFSVTDLDMDLTLLYAIETPNLLIRCARARQGIDLRSAQIEGGLWIQDLDAEKVDASLSHVGRLTLAGRDGGDAPCPFPSRVEDLILTAMEGDTVRLESHIGHSLWADDASVRDLSFAGPAALLGPDAFLNLRRASIVTLSLPPDLLRRAKARLDIGDADITAIRLSDARRDDPQGVPRRDDLSGRNLSAAGPADYRALIFDQLMPALGLSDTDSARQVYLGGVYATLRKSALAAGYPDIEKKIAIAQNTHYAETLDSPMARSIYTLGRLINGYGYDNARGVIWLFALWLAGLVILNMEWLLIAPVKSIIWPGAGITPSQPRLLQSAFFSIDRTIPSLSLDAEFSEASRGAGVVGQLGTTLARVKISLIYVQRLLGFIVVLFMLGGVFNLFQ